MRSERGSILPLTALVIVALLAFVSLAIDGGNLLGQRRAQQRGADIAALGGVQRLVETGSEAQARDRVLDLLQVNGFEADDYDVTVEAISATELRVELVDPDADLFFAQMFLDQSVSVGAEATATLANCGAACPGVIATSVEVVGFEAASEGDGWTPTIAGDRMFALNHHENDRHNSLVCVERTTRTPCPGYPVSLGSYTNDISELTFVPATNELWYAHQTRDWFGVGCWHTTQDRSCGTIRLADLSVGRTNEKNVRGSYPVLVEGNLYLVDDNHDMHCVDPTTRSPCGGSPRTSPFAGQASIPPDGAQLSTTNDRNFVSRDVQVIGTKIFTTLDVRGIDETFVGCYDVAGQAPCVGWPGPVRLPDVGTGFRGGTRETYLFTSYDTALRPNGICGHEDGDHACLDIDTGAPLAQVAGLEAARPSSGVRSELYLDGRTYFAAQTASATHCWDWTTRSSCGQRFGTTALDPTGRETPQDYGYAWDGNCIIGLGDSGYFFSFDKNLNACGSGESSFELLACTCNDGRPIWGEVTFEAPPGTTLAGISVTIVDAGGVEVLAPTDLETIGGRLDLGELGVAPPLELFVDPTFSSFGLTTPELIISNTLTVRPTLID